jgi:hypothetical protein
MYCNETRNFTCEIVYPELIDYFSKNTNEICYHDQHADTVYNYDGIFKCQNNSNYMNQNGQCGMILILNFNCLFK